MEDSLTGAIAAGVVCGILFIVTVAVICFLIYRCTRYEEEKSSQHAPLMNGHIANGGIPTVAALVPLPAASPSRHVYQFPTMPVRHMSSYRPRYIEERKPEGHGFATRPQTYSGAYSAASKGPVYYDVRQHGGYRAYREPVWAERGVEEAEATMMLGEESPKSERHFVVEENNNYTNRSSVKRQSSVISSTEEQVVERRSFRTKDIKMPSPDEARRSYLFTSEPEEPAPTAESSNEEEHNISNLKESTNQSEVNVLRESRRQRRGEDGVLATPPASQRQSSLRQSDPSSQEPIMAVILPDGTESTQEEPSGYIQRYFINDDVYTVSVPDNKGDQSSDPQGLRVIGRPVGQPDVNSDLTGPETGDVIGQNGPPVQTPQGGFNGKSSNKDFRVIKAKRRPSWLQNAGQWFSKKKNK